MSDIFAKMVKWFHQTQEERMMSKKTGTKLVHEGEYAAEVKIELIEDDSGWQPCLSLDDARKLDDMRKALVAGDLKAATRLGQVFRLMPVAV